MNVETALSNLLLALKVLGALFALVVVAGTWAFVRDLGRTLTGRGA